jgi:hypothetical protein
LKEQKFRAAKEWRPGVQAVGSKCRTAALFPHVATRRRRRRSATTPRGARRAGSASPAASRPPPALPCAPHTYTHHRPSRARAHVPADYGWPGGRRGGATTTTNHRAVVVSLACRGVSCARRLHCRFLKSRGGTMVFGVRIWPAGRDRMIGCRWEELINPTIIRIQESYRVD